MEELLIADLKAHLNLRDLVAQTHDIIDNKVLCPAHSDTSPSCHLYEDHLFCFACGWRGDALDWLRASRLLAFEDALAELRRLAASTAPVSLPSTRAQPRKKSETTGIPLTVLERHQRLANQLSYVPGALRHRGFTVGELRRLGIAAIGETAVLPIPDPSGNIVALKQRFHPPRSGQRYRYLTPGHGAPPWCSPDFLAARLVLVIEGELNGMAAWLARPNLAVMGVAGIGGSLNREALTDKLVFVYADFDEAGAAARAKWCAMAIEAGALCVRSLEPWSDGDACDIAGTLGRTVLRRRLPR